MRRKAALNGDVEPESVALNGDGEVESDVVMMFLFRG